MIDNKTLLAYAKEAMNNAYAPYSKFKVGAALLTEDDRIYTGCNIENSSYGAAMCAERTAIYKAISDGNYNFKKIAIAASSEEYAYPCGLCRQVMSEFFHGNEKIILWDKNNGVAEIEFGSIMPYPFNKDCLK